MCVAKSLDKHTEGEKKEMSLYHMERSDQSEINLINGSSLTDKMEQ